MGKAEGLQLVRQFNSNLGEANYPYFLLGVSKSTTIRLRQYEIISFLKQRVVSFHPSELLEISSKDTLSSFLIKEMQKGWFTFFLYLLHS